MGAVSHSSPAECRRREWLVGTPAMQAPRMRHYTAPPAADAPSAHLPCIPADCKQVAQAKQVRTAPTRERPKPSESQSTSAGGAAWAASCARAASRSCRRMAGSLHANCNRGG